jgi:hypothetical protein
MVQEAQAEADRRVQEAEKTGRAAYDRKYADEASGLEASFQRDKAGVQASYTEGLDAYRKDLDALPANQTAFNAVLDALIGGGKQ